MNSKSGSGYFFRFNLRFQDVLWMNYQNSIIVLTLRIFLVLDNYWLINGSSSNPCSDYLVLSVSFFILISFLRLAYHYKWTPFQDMTQILYVLNPKVRIKYFTVYVHLIREFEVWTKKTSRLDDESVLPHWNHSIINICFCFY